MFALSPPSCRRVVIAGIVGTSFALLVKRGSARAFATAGAPAPYKLHLYDHCPFCIRVELLLGLYGIPYERVVYGYGEGAPPEKHGYGAGPKTLTGKKMLPVLQGSDVPAPAGMAGLPESLDICSFLIAKHGLNVPCGTGRLDKWKARFSPVKSKLSRPRVVKMPVQDWENDNDVAYARQKYEGNGFDYSAALAETPTLLEEMNELLKELDGLLESDTSVHNWGFSMEDITALPDMKTLSCVDGLVWPPRVRKWVDSAYGKCASHMELYDKHKC